MLPPLSGLSAEEGVPARPLGPPQSICRLAGTPGRELLAQSNPGSPDSIHTDWLMDEVWLNKLLLLSTL